MSSLFQGICQRARPTTLAALIADLEACDDAVGYISELRTTLFESVGEVEGEMLIGVERREV